MLTTAALGDIAALCESLGSSSGGLRTSCGGLDSSSGGLICLERIAALIVFK